MISVEALNAKAVKASAVFTCAAAVRGYLDQLCTEHAGVSPAEKDSFEADVLREACESTILAVASGVVTPVKPTVVKSPSSTLKPRKGLKAPTADIGPPPQAFKPPTNDDDLEAATRP